MNKRVMTVLSVVLLVALSGCRTAQKDGPVVSPDRISDTSSNANAPTLPHMTPWWLGE